MLTEQEVIEITARRRLERFREVEMMDKPGHFELRWVPGEEREPGALRRNESMRFRYVADGKGE